MFFCSTPYNLCVWGRRKLSADCYQRVGRGKECSPYLCCYETLSLTSPVRQHNAFDPPDMTASLRSYMQSHPQWTKGTCVDLDVHCVNHVLAAETRPSPIEISLKSHVFCQFSLIKSLVPLVEHVTWPPMNGYITKRHEVIKTSTSTSPCKCVFN